MSEGVTNILMVGVGGQGVILASEIVSDVMMRAGHDVKKSEVHGMAQRGGSVNSHVRFGGKVHSPIIAQGEVDILFSFELLETLRYLDWLRRDTIVLVNEQKILPPSVTLGAESYPEDIPAQLRQRFDSVAFIDARAIAREAGNVRAQNVAFCGALAHYIQAGDELWQKSIRAMLPEKLAEVNLRAFQRGRSAIQGEGGTQ